MSVFNIKNFLRSLIWPFTIAALLYMLLLNMHVFGNHNNSVNFPVTDVALWLGITAFVFLFLILLFKSIKNLLFMTFMFYIFASAMTYMYEKNNMIVQKSIWEARGNPGPVYPTQTTFWCHTLPFANCD